MMVLADTPTLKQMKKHQNDLLFPSNYERIKYAKAERT